MGFQVIQDRLTALKFFRKLQRLAAQIDHHAQSPVSQNTVVAEKGIFRCLYCPEITEGKNLTVWS